MFQQQQQLLIKTAMKWVRVNILILSTLFGWNFLEVTLRERIFWKNSRNTDSWGFSLHLHSSTVRTYSIQR